MGFRVPGLGVTWRFLVPINRIVIALITQIKNHIRAVKEHIVDGEYS